MIFIISFIILSIVLAGMAIGVIFSNKPLKGSCGGLNALGLSQDCEICGKDPEKCEKRRQKAVKIPIVNEP